MTFFQVWEWGRSTRHTHHHVDWVPTTLISSSSLIHHSNKKQEFKQFARFSSNKDTSLFSIESFDGLYCKRWFLCCNYVESRLLSNIQLILGKYCRGHFILTCLSKRLIEREMGTASVTNFTGFSFSSCCYNYCNSCSFLRTVWNPHVIGLREESGAPERNPIKNSPRISPTAYRAIKQTTQPLCCLYYLNWFFIFQPPVL